MNGDNWMSPDALLTSVHTGSHETVKLHPKLNSRDVAHERAIRISIISTDAKVMLSLLYSQSRR